MSCYLIFFFFKQKTAYEMRISDWSSDVCSSDLHHRSQLRRLGACPGGAFQRWWSFRPDICLRQALGGCSQRVAINTIPPDLGRCPSSPPQFSTDGAIGRASCRESVCQYVSISVVACSLKKNNIQRMISSIH